MDKSATIHRQVTGVDDRNPKASPGFITRVREQKPSMMPTGRPGGRYASATALVTWSRIRTTTSVTAARVTGGARG